MKLNAVALAYTGAALCGGSVLLVGLVNLGTPTYGWEFLKLLDSVYPGYTANGTIESVMVATGYALVEGAVLGWGFGWLYNRLLKS